MNEGVKRVLEIEREKGAGLTIDDIHEQVAGIYPKVMTEGDMDAGAWSCGMVAGLIHDIPSCQELIDRIMAEAERLIHQRLARLVSASCWKRPVRPHRTEVNLPQGVSVPYPAGI